MQRLGPAGDDAAYRKLGRLTALVGAVEDFAADQRAFVVGAHGGAGGRRSAATGFNHFVLQAGWQRHHSVAGGIALEKLQTRLASGAGRFLGQRLHLALQCLESRLHGRFVNRAGLLGVSITQAVHDQFDSQVGDVARQQLVAHLTANAVAHALFVGFESIAHDGSPEK